MVGYDRRRKGRLNDYSAATMVTGPSATALANPLGVISTMDGSELVQSTEDVMSLPRSSTALNCNLSPTEIVRLAGTILMEIDVDCPPAPDKLITVRGFAAVLVTATLPDTLPLLDGEKVTVKLTLSPASKIVPREMPLASNPGPETLTFEIVMESLLIFVRVTPRTPLPPTFTSPKSTFETLPNSCDIVPGDADAPGALASAVVCGPDPGAV